MYIYIYACVGLHLYVYAEICVYTTRRHQAPFFPAFSLGWCWQSSRFSAFDSVESDWSSRFWHWWIINRKDSENLRSEYDTWLRSERFFWRTVCFLITTVTHLARCRNYQVSWCFPHILRLWGCRDKEKHEPPILTLFGKAQDCSSARPRWLHWSPLRQFLCISWSRAPAVLYRS